MNKISTSEFFTGRLFCFLKHKTHDNSIAINFKHKEVTENPSEFETHLSQAEKEDYLKSWQYDCKELKPWFFHLKSVIWWEWTKNIHVYIQFLTGG